MRYRASHAQLPADIFHIQIIHRLLEDGEIGLILQPRADRLFVEHAVGLGAGGLHRTALGIIENAKLDARFVGGNRHRAAQCINLFDQVTLADPADGRVAAHRAQGFNIVGEQQSFCAHARRAECRFGTRMPAADDYHVEVVGVGEMGLGGVFHVKQWCLG